MISSLEKCFDVAEFKKLAAAYLDVMEDIPKVIQRPRWEGVDEAEHIIYRGLDPHGVTMIQFRAESLGERWRQEEMQVLTHILTQRLIGKIRQEMGDAYGINMSYGFPFDPITDAVGVYVCYISQPAKAKRLKEQTLQVIDTFLRNGLAEEEVASAKDVIRLQVKQGQASNAFWIKLHVQAVCQDLSIKEVLTEKEDLSWITPETIHALGKRIFAAPAQSVSLYPEKHLP